MQTSYAQIPDLQHIYLEDSYVLNVKEYESRLVFLLEAVLTEQHPQYLLPAADEYYCYRRATLVFPATKRVIWLEKHFKPYRDTSDHVDYGNIDIFYAQDDVYHLEGDWGRVVIDSNIPYLSFVDETSV